VTPEGAVIARLQEIGDVTALVGDRIFMLVIRQGSILPAIRVQLIDDVLDYHLKGGTPVGPARVQVDCWAVAASGTDPYADANSVAAAIHGDDAGSGLSGWSGSLGSPPFDVRGIFRVDRAVSWESEERREVRVRQDYQIHFRA
jgi:hypothetical protein